MAITPTVTPAHTFPRGRPVTLPALRKGAEPSLSLSGTVATGDIAAGAVTAAKLAYGAVYYTDSSSFASNTYTVTPTPAVGALANGVEMWFKASADSADTQAQINVSALGAKKIYKHNDVALEAGDIRNGQIVGVRYLDTLDSGSGGWQLISDEGHQDHVFGTTAGTANTQTLTNAPTITSLTYIEGRPIFVKVGSGLTNTGATTLNVDGLGAKAIRRRDDKALTGGELVPGRIYGLIYDSAANAAAGAFLLVAEPLPAFYQGTDAGSTDAYAVTVESPPAAYFDGMKVLFKANTANTGVATLNVNSIGAATIKKYSSVDLATGDIKASQWVEVVYDGTNFQLVTPVSTSTAGQAAAWVAFDGSSAGNGSPGSGNATAITAMDAGTDQITVTGHGITAATSPDTVTLVWVNANGGTLPTGLAGNTPYYAYVVDPNTLTLHTTPTGGFDGSSNIVDISGSVAGSPYLCYLDIMDRHKVAGVLQTASGTGHATGLYRVYWLNAFSSANYLVMGTCKETGTQCYAGVDTTDPASSSVKYMSVFQDNGAGHVNASEVHVLAFGS